LEYVASYQVGRVGISTGALPVNDVVFGPGVLFRPAAGTTLDDGVRGTVVALDAEADDSNGRARWSVLLVGKANKGSDPVELEHAEGATLPPWPGVTGRPYDLQSKAERISSRQFARSQRR
jgi:hypothetical protein